MKDTENVLKSFDEARDAQPQGHEQHHEDSKRPRARGQHGSAASAPSPRRQPRRRAATRTSERRTTNADPRLTPGSTGAMTENSLDLFLRAARAHALLTAEDIGTVARNVIKPLTVNMGFGIRQRPTTPLLSTRQLEDLGVKAVSFPRMLTAAAIQGMKNALAVLGQSITEGRVIDRPDLLVPFDELNDLMGLKQLRAIERSFAASPVGS